LIFVTIGSAVKGIEFTRLIKKMDEVAERIDEEVVMQIGTVPYVPKHASFFKYCSYQESLEYFKKASLVVGHCGTGTILNALHFQKPIIVVPRRTKFGELNRDDHQIEIAQRLKGISKIHVVYEVEDLEGVVKKLLLTRGVEEKGKSFPEREKLIQTIMEFVSRTN
jgi:UDP-N-acetylglucosamine transferase subunit ALG13